MLPVTKIQRFSTHDGEGIRTVVFIKGCPLQCWWCHNPETAAKARAFYYDSEKCLSCSLCSGVCGDNVHRFENGTHKIQDSFCTSCGKCAEACPAGALQRTFTLMSEEEILKEVLKDAVFYGDNGGLTLSGGEPMSHPEQSVRLLSMAKEAKINTATETSGFFDKKYIPLLQEVSDTVLLDVKDTVDKRHIENTGVSNKTVIENLFLLDGYKTNVILRCIMLKNVNTGADNLDGIAEIYKKLKHCGGVELLPYHPFGSSKSVQLGLGDYSNAEFIPSAGEMKKIKQYLIENGVCVL